MGIPTRILLLIMLLLALSGCSSSDQQDKKTEAAASAVDEGDVTAHNKNLEVISARFYQLYQPFKSSEPDDLSDFIAEYGTEFLTPTLEKKLTKALACEKQKTACKLELDPFYASKNHLVLEAIKRTSNNQVRVQFADKVNVILSFECKDSCRIDNVIYGKNDDLLSRLN